MDKVQAFDCPNCGASLDYDDSDDLTVRCPYCNTSVIVPEELRAEKLVQLPPRKPARPARRFSCIWIVLLFLVVIGAAIAIAVRSFDNSVVEVLDELEVLDEFNPVDSFAHVDLTFGREGTGPGLFTDARHIAVDGEGNVYVGEYSDGRIQVFDVSGEFVSLWMLNNDTPLIGMAADRQGTVYIIHGGEIFRYEGATGELLNQVEYAEGRGFDDVAVTADGGLVTSWRKHRDDLVRFDAQGQAVWTVEAAISGQTGDSELDTRVAVDGLGNIYALGTFHDAVFKFTPDGQFVNRFGSAGDEPGQFRAPHAIAVDGQGRVYVSDIKGIQVFGEDGRYLDLIEVDGPAFGMAFNDQNELLVAARHKVIKYVLRQPQSD